MKTVLIFIILVDWAHNQHDFVLIIFCFTGTKLSIFFIYFYYSAMETGEESQPVSSSEQSDSGDGDIPFGNSRDARLQDITMETDHSENADTKGAILILNFKHLSHDHVY